MTFFERLELETAAARFRLLTTPIIVDALQGRILKSQYLAFLTQAYHHVRHTVPLLMACGSRLPDRLEWLRTSIADYIKEELGHDEWILSDIAACGGDANAVRHGQPNFATQMMIAYAYHQIDRRNPVGFFGMIHVLEGTSVAIATNAATAIGTALQLPSAAFTYLSSHGSIDVEHVGLFKSLVNKLDDSQDQAAIVGCAVAIYRLYGEIFRSLPQYDEALGSREAA